MVSYSNKQLIAHEIDTEKMRRLEFQKTGDNAAKSTKKAEKGNAGKELPNHLQRLKPKVLKSNNETVSTILFYFVAVFVWFFFKFRKSFFLRKSIFGLNKQFFYVIGNDWA